MTCVFLLLPFECSSSHLEALGHFECSQSHHTISLQVSNLKTITHKCATNDRIHKSLRLESSPTGVSESLLCIIIVAVGIILVVVVVIRKKCEHQKLFDNEGTFRHPTRNEVTCRRRS